MPTHALVLSWGDLRHVNLLFWRAAGVLLAAHLLVVFLEYGLGYDYAFGVILLFHLYYEGNLPTYFSALILLLAGTLILYGVGIGHLSEGARQLHWRVLGYGFIVMSVDEATDARMILSRLVGRLMGVDDLARLIPGIYQGWTVPMIGLVLVLAVFFAPFLRSLPRPFLSRALFAGAVYVFAAVGLENLGFLWVAVTGRGGLVFVALVTVEEMAEIGAVLYFQRALLDELDRRGARPLSAAAATG